MSSLSVALRRYVRFCADYFNERLIVSYTVVEVLQKAQIIGCSSRGDTDIGYGKHTE